MKKSVLVAASGVVAVMSWTITGAAADAQEPLSSGKASLTDSILPGPRYEMRTDDGDPGGKVEFWTVGDHVRVTDTQADGKSVEVVVWNVTKDPNKKEYVLLNDGGKDYEEWGHGNVAQPWNLAEGSCFLFRIRLLDNGKPLHDSTDYAHWRNYNDTTQNCDGVE
ncbi:hypothetical protein [Actinomadura madurae]|uniref:Uncharacterized protein n=1 Tax=Actinomadura madurae TaxID=1993 RepID=A0A1I5TQR5_9ACTN|nr:hypothetical protein [Actinomadura madurae]SFP85231.1 hypothetical protein SAMN04489713_11884 [Actinomadura madurae]SPT51646.1 Uncharacterised protein [Actinomadura madurae]